MKHHPSKPLLQQFAAADLDLPTSTLISAHIEACSSCAKEVHAIEQRLSNDCFETGMGAVDSEAIWEKFRLSLRSAELKPTAKISENPTLTIQGHRFTAPRALAKILRSDLKWKTFGSGGRIAKLQGSGESDLFLIHLPPKQSVPLHTHSDKEYSYVIAGRFFADGETYESGDFGVSDSAVRHAPVAGDDDGCLLISSIQGRLNFFTGWLTPLNVVFWRIITLGMRS